MKNIITKSITTILLISGITACSTTGKIVSGNYDLQSADKHGLIIISVAYNDEVCNPHFFSINMYNTNLEPGITTISVKGPFSSGDFSNPYGRLEILEFPAGKYGIASMEFITFGEALKKNATSFEYKFNVRPGHIIYLGELEFKFKDSSCSSFKYRVNNRWSRDSRIFHEQVQGIDLRNVEIMLLKNRNTDQ